MSGEGIHSKFFLTHTLITLQYLEKKCNFNRCESVFEHAVAFSTTF
jgi:hypothetical protein